jgi:excisionase family DNA binding protein
MAEWKPHPPVAVEPPQAPLPFLPKNLLTVTQAAQALGLSAQMVRLLANQGDLPCYRLGPDGHRYFERKCVEEYAVERQVMQLMTRGRGMRVAYAARRSR